MKTAAMRGRSPSSPVSFSTIEARINASSGVTNGKSGARCNHNFQTLDPGVRFERVFADGAHVEAGAPLARLRGRLAPLLAAERTALNFLMRLCGIATHTRRFVLAVEGTGVAIVDTRKTLPGWRALDKYATAVGGATNHRVGLFDGILLKDNHVAVAGGVALAVKAALLVKIINCIFLR